MFFLLFSLCTFIQHFNISQYQNVNFYHVTNLETDSTEKEIRRGYNKFLKQKKHYIREQGNRYENYWQQIEFAYSILGNNYTRFLYNHKGTDFLNYTDFSVANYLSDEEIAAKIQLMGNLLPEVQYYGGLTYYPVEFELEDFFFGAKKTIKSARYERCKCPGELKTCTKCDKEPYIEGEGEYELVLPPGAYNLHRVVAIGLGDSPDLRAPEAIVFVATARKHQTFERKGRDLFMNLTVNVEDCLSDDFITIIGIDGNDIKIPTKYAQTHSSIVIPNQGMPDYFKPSERGDLIVNYVLNLPSSLDQEQKLRIQEILPNDNEFYL